MKTVDMYLKKGLTGKPLGKVKGIVIHWFASPMAKAENVIKYWEGQANRVNAHDVIDLDGTLYHAVPYNMMAYQVGCPRGYTTEAIKRLSTYPNDCVVGIECAHVDMTGKMTDATYKTLVEHSANLLKKFGLTTDNLWLHSEIVGKDYKDCHRWFTTTKPSDWIKFKKDVASKMKPTVKIAVVNVAKKVVAVVTGKKYYTVKSGDVVSKIALDNKVSIDQIKKLNKLDSNCTITIGQKLRIK